MSEETNSSATASETEKTEMTSAPAGKSGGKPWLMIAAVIVAIMLVSTGLYFFVLAKPGLTAKISPSPAGVDAGTTIALEVTAKSAGKLLSDKDVKLMWTVQPNNMGTFDFHTKPKVNLSAANTQQNGTLSCSVEYNGKTVTASAPLQIRAPGLDRVSVAPSETWVKYNTSQVFTAKGISTISQNMTGLTFTWTATGLTSNDYTITTINGTSISFTAKAVPGNVTLSATTTYKNTTKTGTGLAKVTEFLPVRTVNYRWYDVFDVPFGPWYPRRTLYYPGADYEAVWSNTYPYIYEYFGDSHHHNLYLYSNMRLNITAMNLEDVNMSRPLFLPLFGTTTGGHAVLNWHMQYLDPALVDATYGSAATMYNDGWFINLTGVTTLDKEAAMAVTGMTASDFDNFDTYWATKGGALRDAWQTWLIEYQANTVYDVNNMYGTPAQMIGFGLHAAKVGDKVVLTVFADTWGMDALMARWLRAAFIPCEIWVEGFWMNATIGPQTSNIYIKTDIEYGVYAFMSRNDTSSPVWLWKPLFADYFESSGDHPKSEFDPYAKSPYTYKNWNPGSALYGTDVAYDVTPCAWNLTDNETMSFTWPSGLQQFELDAVGHTVKNVSSNMAISYAEPMPTDYSSTYLKNGSIKLNSTSRTLTYTGPLDFWHWSETQNAPNHQILRQQWIDTQYKLLPESAPWVEFGTSLPPPHLDHFVISNVYDLPVVGQAADVTVAAYDQYNSAFKGYTGTIHFGTNRSSDVTLPPDYHFTAGDHGMKNFTNNVTFLNPGWFMINATDTSNHSVKGSYTDIMAIPTAQVIHHFTVKLSTKNGTALSPIDVTVTAWNQYGRVFREYTGTINLTTNASIHSFLLPLNYTFLLSENGVHKFQGAAGAAWNSEGTYNLTVIDTVVKTANCTVKDIHILTAAVIKYRIYNMFEDRWMPFWAWRWKTYGTDIILSNQPGNYTMIYYWGGDVSIWGPYRMNITATNLTNVNVHKPLFMPIMDSNRTFANANATIQVYFQYLYYNWWNNTWVKRWSTDPNWYGGSMLQESTDGWYLGVIYNVTMNRETAQEWMRLPVTLPVSTTVADWWAQNASYFKKSWKLWLLDQENNVTDVYNAYEFPGAVTGPYANLTELPNGEVRLEIAHVSYAYEIIMDKWLTKYGICSHQPYLENLTLVAREDNKRTNLTLDTVCQYSLKAVRANQSAGIGSAWAFEAVRIDYVASSPNHPYSDYDRFVGLTYMSWNAGDIYFDQRDAQDAYETTPGWFNLTANETLIFELPMHQVICYEGRGIHQLANPTDTMNANQLSINNITYGKWNLKTGKSIYGKYPWGAGSIFGNRTDYSDYDTLVHYGHMSLGYYITNLVPGQGAENQNISLSSMYDSVTKTLTIHGPHNFDNSGRGAGSPMYHGAPWIEFNVSQETTSTVSSAAGPSIVDHGSAATLDQASASEIMALTAVVYATLATIVVLVIDLRRRNAC